jgi:hypothetical protein
MFNAFAKVTASKDLTPEIKKMLDDLAKSQVYVGVPEGSDNDRGTEITNSELLYIQTHGVRMQEMRDEMNPKVESGEMPYSKAYKSPPRPVIEPAIENSKDVIAKQLQKVATTALDGQDPTVEMQKAGMLGQNIVRDWFTNPANGWAPNSPITAKRKGSDRPLIDSGELRKSITYVIQDGK